MAVGVAKLNNYVSKRNIQTSQNYVMPNVGTYVCTYVWTYVWSYVWVGLSQRYERFTYVWPYVRRFGWLSTELRSFHTYGNTSYRGMVIPPSNVATT